MKAALIQQSYTGDKESMRRKTAEAVKRSAESGAQLVLLQELHQTEYFCQCEATRYFDYARSFDDDLRYWA